MCASPTSPSEYHSLHSISSDTSSSLPLHGSLTENEDSLDGKQVEVSYQTDLVSVTYLERDNQCLRSEVPILKCSKGSITSEAFMNNSELLKMLHRLPNWKIFNADMNLALLPKMPNSKLSTFEMLALFS